MLLTAGVDPGLSGAVAVTDTTGDFLHVEDMPTYSVKVGDGNRRRLNLRDLCDIFTRLQLMEVKLVVLEDVWGFPGQGARAAFWLGHSAGAVAAAISASHLSLHMVTPKVWKSEFRLPSDKDSARRRATDWFPKHSHLWARKGDDGRAEATLLARYAQQQLARSGQ